MYLLQESQRESSALVELQKKLDVSVSLSSPGLQIMDELEDREFLELASRLMGAGVFSNGQVSCIQVSLILFMIFLLVFAANNFSWWEKGNSGTSWSLEEVYTEVNTNQGAWSLASWLPTIDCPSSVSITYRQIITRFMINAVKVEIIVSISKHDYLVGYTSLKLSSPKIAFSFFFFLNDFLACYLRKSCRCL